MMLMRREVVFSTLAIVVSWITISDGATKLRLFIYVFTAAIFLTAVGILVGLLSTAKWTVPIQNKSQSKYNTAFVKTSSWQQNLEWLDKKSFGSEQDLFDSPAVSRSLDELLAWICRDFVTSWYQNITPTPEFSDQINSLLKQCLSHMKEKLGAQDIVEVAAARLLPLITEHLQEFYEAEHAVRGKNLNRNVTESEELDLAIASKYKLGKLHPATASAFSDARFLQQDYIRKLVLRLLPQLLPVEIVQSRATIVLIREIVTCAVLTPVMQLLSDPDFWNQLMEAYGTTMLQDRKTVRKLRAALDEHASPANKSVKVTRFPRLSSQDDERKFERFIRSIRGCNNLSEARRFRSEVASQLKRESMIVGRDPTYIRRLQIGKQILDQRVTILSSVGKTSRRGANLSSSTENFASKMTSASLKEVLHDASGLSYFMEYMDRHNHMLLIQFWLVVEGLRNPLEDDAVEDNMLPETSASWTESDKLDIAQISESYLSRKDLPFTADAQEAVVKFLKAGRNATSFDYAKARRSILASQSRALEYMQEQHFPGFRRSDLFYKLLSRGDDQVIQSKDMPQVTSRPPFSLEGDQATTQSATRPESATNRANIVPRLHRNASSHSDLKASLTVSDASVTDLRRSLDMDIRQPLFDDDIDASSHAWSTLDNEAESKVEESGNGSDDTHAVEAVEAALSNIISEPEYISRGDLFSDAADQGSTKEPNGEVRPYSTDISDKVRERPNLASLGLVNTSSRIGVFRDNDLFGDEEKFLEDEHADPEVKAEKASADDEIHEAEPGDLGLTEAVTALTIDIDRLIAQESVVNTLTKKAELTNNVAELRILNKSRASLQRELRRKELQRQQYIVQESDNSLYGRAVINIKSVMVGKEEDGQEYALYVIEVQRKAGEHMPAATWAVARRYSEFHELHQRLRHSYAAVRQLEFPRRRLVMKLQRDFLHKRREALQNYLSQLLLLPAVCKSRDLRAFLSQHPIISTSEMKSEVDRGDLVSRIYNSVTDGMDEFLGNVPVLDQLSAAGQNLISAATSQYNPLGGTRLPEDPAPSDIVATHEEQAELEAYENQALQPFVKPICDLFLEAFELNRSQNWLRGRAVVVVLHQLLGGTVERKVRETVKSLMSESNLLRHLALIKEMMWPNGSIRLEKKTRTLAQKNASKHQASIVLATLLPELVGGVVGRTNAQAAGRRIFATLNNERLNAHLMFRLLDEIIAILFASPDIGGKS